MLTLTTMVDRPFEHHPQLLTIWPEPYMSLAVEATNQDWASCGPLFVNFNSEVVGITGLFYEEQDPDNAFLRWTGIVPHRRRTHNLGARAINKVAYLAANVGLRRGYLVELLPANEYGDQQRPFFDYMGFKDVRSEIKAHEDTDWDVHVLGLDLRNYIR